MIAIYSMCDPAVKVYTQILGGKVTRKCRIDKVFVPIVALAAQCAERVQLTWLEYLRGELLVNCCEAQELSKAFHYVWLLLSILLVEWELPEDNLFPSVELDLLEAAKYTSLWETKDAQ